MSAFSESPPEHEWVQVACFKKWKDPPCLYFNICHFINIHNWNHLSNWNPAIRSSIGSSLWPAQMEIVLSSCFGCGLLVNAVRKQNLNVRAGMKIRRFWCQRRLPVQMIPIGFLSLKIPVSFNTHRWVVTGCLTAPAGCQNLTKENRIPVCSKLA